MKPDFTTRMALVSSALALALVVLAAPWQLHRLLAANSALLGQQQLALAEIAAADLDYKIRVHQDMVIRAAREAGSRLAAGASGREALVPALGLRPAFDHVALLDTTGVVVAGDPPLADPPVLGDREYFKEARDQGKVVMSPPLMARRLRQPAVVMAAPVDGPGGRPVAVLAALLSLQGPNILGELNRTSRDGERYYVLVTQGMAPIAIVHPDVTKILGTAPDASERDGDVVAAAPVPSAGWVLRVVTPARAARAPLERAGIEAGLILAALGLAWVTLVWFSTRRLLRPLHALLDAMRRLRERPGKPVRIDTSAADELGALAREFDALMAEQRAQHQQLAVIADESPLGLFRTDAQGRLTYVNEAYLTIHGLRREQAAEGWLLQVRPEVRDRVRSEWRRAVSGAEPLHVVRKIARADGAERLVSVRSRPIWAAGEVAGHVGTVSDITERARAERAAKTLTAIFDTTPDFVVQLDTAGRLLYMNPAARRCLGLDPDGPLEHLVMEALNPPETLERLRKEAVPAAKAKGVWVGESLAWNVRREAFPVSHTVIAHRGPEGGVEFFSAIMRDISTEKAAQSALADSEHRLRMITDHLPVLIAYLAPDMSYQFVNRTYEDWYGVGPRVGSGMTVRDYYGDEAWSRIAAPMQEAMRGRAVSYERTLERNGRERIEQVTLVPDQAVDGAVKGLFALVTDIKPFRDAERALVDSETRIRTVADALPIRVAYIDAEQRYRFNNRAYEAAFKRPREEIEGRTVREILGDAAYRDVEPHVRRVLAGEAVTFQSEMLQAGKFVCYEAQYIPQWDAERYRVIGFHAIVTDVTRQKTEERRLIELARIDSLTGVLNRSGFDVKLCEAIERSRQNHSLLGLMILDVDRFKQVNDGHGHQAGDELLCAFAGRLVQALRASDVVCRLGGDEFTVIMEGLTRREDAQALAGKIVAIMRRPFVLGSLAVEVSASAGLAFCQSADCSAAELVGLADRELYEAKAAGRDGFRSA